MKPKRYSSFREINHDLKILRLELEIAKENLKLNLQRTKSSFYPTRLLGGFGGVLQKLILSVLATKIFKRLG